MHAWSLWKSGGYWMSWNCSYRQVWATWYGCWAPNPGPLQDQQVLLIIDPSLHPLVVVFLNKISYCNLNYFVTHCVTQANPKLKILAQPSICKPPTQLYTSIFIFHHYHHMCMHVCMWMQTYTCGGQLWGPFSLHLHVCPCVGTQVLKLAHRWACWAVSLAWLLFLKWLSVFYDPGYGLLKWIFSLIIRIHFLAVRWKYQIISLSQQSTGVLVWDLLMNLLFIQVPSLCFMYFLFYFILFWSY